MDLTGFKTRPSFMVRRDLLEPEESNEAGFYSQVESGGKVPLTERAILCS